MEFIICLIVGFVLGMTTEVILWSIYMQLIRVGTLRVADDGVDDPYLFLELKNNPEFILKRKYVVFNVNPDKITPRK